MEACTSSATEASSATSLDRKMRTARKCSTEGEQNLETESTGSRTSDDMHTSFSTDSSQSADMDQAAETNSTGSETRQQNATTTYFMRISLDEWCTHLNTHGNKLNPGWTESMVERLKEVPTPQCSWVFKHSSVNPHKRKRKPGAYVRIYAKCQRDECNCCPKIVAKEVPTDPSEDISFVITRVGHPDHDGSPARRPLRGESRAKAAERTI